MLKYVDYDIVFQEIPDETTLAINLSNCPNRCPGCHSAHLKRDIGERLDETVLEKLLRQYGAAVTCVCFMGGDNDPEEVARLAGFLRTYGPPKLKVGWYSGRERLPEGFSLQNFQYLKLGPYVAERGGLRSPTTNQRLYRIAENGTQEDITGRLQRGKT